MAEAIKGLPSDCHPASGGDSPWLKARVQARCWPRSAWQAASC